LAFASQAVLNPVGLSPANGATNVCTDTLLRITFDAPPSFGNSGQVYIFTQAGVPVDTNDMSLCINKPGAPSVQARRIAGMSYYTFPIIVSGNTATIYPHSGVLAPNQTYNVTMTPGLFFNGGSGAFGGISDSTTWRFTTKPLNPSSSTNHLVVAADGSADYCTVQGAIDSIPNGNSARLIEIRNGIYEEIVFLTNQKHNIKFRGEDRHQTIIKYRNNDNLNSGSSTRSLFNMRGDDVAIENLTLTNSTPNGGSQAEALRADGRRLVVNGVNLASYQDTLLLNSLGRYSYFNDCLIQGSVDFIWNDGVGVFQNCEIKSLTSGGYICQMRSDVTRYGAVFLDCLLTKAAGVSGCYLNRCDPSSMPDAAAAFINCRMDTHITSAGWLLFGAATPTGGLRFWEFQSTNLAGSAAINVSTRAPYSSQLTEPQARLMRNLTNVYAPNSLWLPQLAPNIVTQPADQEVTPGGNADFVVEATGIQTENPTTAGEPSVLVPLHYQWLKHGTNLLGATNSVLTISNVTGLDAGIYSVVVSNSSGTIISKDVALSVTSAGPPEITFAAYASGQFTLMFDSEINGGFSILASSNLMDWESVFTANAPLLPYSWTDSNAIAPQRFYRVLAFPQ